MRPKLLLNVAALSLCTVFYAQQVDVYVHFPKGSALMEDESRLALMQWAELNAVYSCEPLLLRGHTDTDAGTSYNLSLSQRRNESVSDILADLGFKNIRYTSHGESWPLCSDSAEECMHENRRVEVMLLNDEEEKFAMKTLSCSPQIVFTETSKPSTINGQGGSLISIPENAFVFPDGTPASDVRIEFHEFLTMKDCVLKGLSTTSDGEILCTGGMMQLRAFSGNREVLLKQGKSIDVVFPSQRKNPDPEMRAFVGEFNAYGINWKMLGDRGIELGNRKSEGKYSARYLRKDGTYQRDITIGGRDILVTYGRDIETVATYSSKDGPVQPLSPNEKQLVLDFINFKTSTASPALSFSQTGWFNCDRFVNNQSFVEQYVEPKFDSSSIGSHEQLEYYMIFDEMSVVLSGRRLESGAVRFSRIPEGKRATLVVIGPGDNESVFAMKDFVTGESSENIELHTLTNDEISSLLDRFALNI